MNQAVIKIRFYSIILSTVLLGVDITLFCYVQYNIWKMPKYASEPSVRAAHFAAEITTFLTCIMCFGQCYVACFERAHSKKHRKALIYGFLSTLVFLANTMCYFIILGGKYRYDIPTRNITAFIPESISEMWFDEIRDYVEDYENKMNASKTRKNAYQFLVTLDYYQELSSCCGVTQYTDFTSLGVPMPESCECGKHAGLLYACTRGKKTNDLRLGGGMLDMSKLEDYRENLKTSRGVAAEADRWPVPVARSGHAWEDDANTTDDYGDENSRGKKKDEYLLKKAVFSHGCEEYRKTDSFVLTMVLRLLVTSNSLQFLSIILIPIPWLYET